MVEEKFLIRWWRSIRKVDESVVEEYRRKWMSRGWKSKEEGG